MGILVKRGRTSYKTDADGKVIPTYYDDKDIDTKAMGRGFDEHTTPYPIKEGHTGRSKSEIGDEDIKEFEDKQKGEKKIAKLEKIKSKRDMLESKRGEIKEQIKGKTEVIKAKAGLRKAKADLWGAKKANVAESIKTVTEPLSALKSNLNIMGERISQRQDQFAGNVSLGAGIGGGGDDRNDKFDFSLGRSDVGSTKKEGGIDFGAKGGGFLDFGKKGAGMFDFGSKSDKFDFSLNISSRGSDTKTKKKKKKSKTQDGPRYIMGFGNQFSSEVIRKGPGNTSSKKKKKKKKKSHGNSGRVEYILPVGGKL